MADQRKTVLITGCSSGIGHSLVEEFLAKGLRVFATARRAESLADLAERGAETLSLEVDKPDSVREAKRKVSELTGGKLDYLVNNAGRNYTMPALDADMAQIEQVFEVNVFAVMRMCQEFAPLIIEAKGTIVQIGSLAGVMPYVFGSIYNATKAALHAYSDTLRVELAPFGVRVVTIVTGGVQSNIAREKRELPPDSYYIPISAEFKRRTTHSQEGAMPNKDYARSVVNKVLQKKPPLWVWEGKLSWTVWFTTSFLPKAVMDSVFWRMFNLWKLIGTADSKKTL
ncbi:NAD(P)-binding protein [Saccharata proteae CBS 121410]|uniref:NAD(P)-binding protein n=1 Tax=Saccharata proteae CBS 121410 TaxID=1314787 RepID=A0A9P4HZ09_9PEZI|nr:NAD(P)-binding protein [Saccharata proteae CBS 121410]